MRRTLEIADFTAKNMMTDVCDEGQGRLHRLPLQNVRENEEVQKRSRGIRKRSLLGPLIFMSDSISCRLSWLESLYEPFFEQRKLSKVPREASAQSSAKTGIELEFLLMRLL